MSVVEVRDGSGRLLAVVVRGQRAEPGIGFLTGPESTLQLGWMRRAAGYEVPAHVHNPVHREIEGTAEVLFVRSGRVRVRLYGDGYEIQHEDLGPGDVIALLAGGHGVEFLEESDVVEVKQGPYAGNRDKARLL